MDEIIRYIAKMLPCILAFIPIYLVIRIIIIFKNKKIDFKREILLLVFYCFLIGVFSQAFTSSLKFSIYNISLKRINLIPFKIIYDTMVELESGNFSYLIISLLGNIGIFIPLGILIKIIWKISDMKTILYGFYISLFIETIQLFIGRNTDIDDLMLNTFGILIGVLLVKIFDKKTV